MKNLRLKKIYLTVCCIFLTITVLQAQEERKYVRKGTDLFGKGDFVEAEIEYRKALDKKPDSYEGRFNVSASQYKQENFQSAVSDLRSLANQTDDPEKLHKIYHNLGNSYLGMTQTDPQNASQYLDLSIDAYKKALKNNPLDDETRYNLIAAMKLKQQQEDNQDQQQQEQQQEQQEQEQEQDQNQDQDQNQNQQQQEQEQQDINRDNAERILQALEQEEKDLHEKLNQQKKAQPVRIDKNW
ncbi:MAG: aerotolerance regulator BatC [Marinilabiliaceae bacterium]|nr:aerotolerance regulator BatC [Marinilabiliaceae bacterium]